MIAGYWAEAAKEKKHRPDPHLEAKLGCALLLIVIVGAAIATVATIGV
jgi:hypothetical protein